jgi:dihydrofolate synthase/folylpolyglutamate synthase
LDSIRNLTGALGNPQDGLKFIHVAGTNGKGSVSSFIGTVLQCSGYKVGRYISPTIYTYRERFQVNGRMIGKKELGEEMAIIKEACDALVLEGKPHPTSFEIETALAFHYFLKKQCDMVVLETGMGGTLDATNIIKNPLLCVLTSISMDHMQYLGETITDIAGNKCGIIKEGCTVVSTLQDEEAELVIEKVCEEKKAKLVFADASLAEYISLGKKGSPSLEKQAFVFEGKQYEISLLGKYQIENAVIAIKALEELHAMGYQKITDAKVKKGLYDTEWKGRFTLLANKPYFVVDGAHNVAAAKKLVRSMQFYFTNRKIVYIMGMFRDKEYEKVIQITAPLASQIITVATPGNPRALPAVELAHAVSKVNPHVTSADSLEEAVEMSYLFADKESVIIGFGSLSFLGELMNIVENNRTVRSDTHGK